MSQICSPVVSDIRLHISSSVLCRNISALKFIIKSKLRKPRCPHAGGWSEACQQAYAFQTELRAIETGIHTGEIPAQGSFISSSSEAFIISAVKATENGKGWLVRGVNLSSEPIHLGLKPLRRFGHAALVDLAEEEISPLPVADDGSVTISATGHKIVSVMFSD
jgi:alpha-mannosidase